MRPGSSHHGVVALATTLLFLPACAFAQAGSQAATPSPGWVARVAPFPVTLADGTAAPQPFLGGFDVPRPQLADIDGDGDLDLFVQERSGEVAFYQREDGHWTWRTDRYQDLDIGEWFRFVDLDGDGDLDLLSELPYSYVRAWLNTGTRTAPRFVAAADSLRAADGTALFADRQNILNLTDIDCNGRLDLFLGRVTGTVDRYEAEPGLDAAGLPRFRLVTEEWEGIRITGPIPGQPMPNTPGGSMHGANTMAFGDIDGDGDQDLFWGDFFEEGVLLIANTGGCPTFSLRSTPTRFPLADPLLTTGYNAPTTGDVDGDGRLDLVVGVIGGAFGPSRSGVENLYLVTQPAPDSFVVVTSRLIPMIDVGSESAPALADIDGDGDLDLVVGSRIAPDDPSTSRLVLFENTGTVTAPALRERGPLPVGGDYHLSPAIVDLDGDGLLDLVLGTWRDVVQWWRNTGTATAPTWTLADSALVTITRGSNTVPALADLDGDGDLDMLVGESSGQLNLYRNTGSRTAPRFELESDTFGDIDAGRRSAPVLRDLDGDGRPDMLLGSEEGTVAAWRNVSEGTTIRFVPDPRLAASVHVPGNATPALGDLDGDGDLDLVVGTTSGGLRYFEAGSRP